MKNHAKWENLLADYLSGLLNEEDSHLFEAHLKTCPQCQAVVQNAQVLRKRLSPSEEKSLSPRGRLRLYERLNAERARRGEKLLRIPEKLLAEASAKWQAAGQAAGEVARHGAHSAADAGKSGATVARTMGRGAKAVGGRAARMTAKGARRARKIAAEMAKTAADVGRVATEEVADVVGDAMQSPFKALLAPPRMAGKAAKMAARVAKGGCKISVVSAKGIAEAGFGTVGLMGEMIRQQGKVTAAMLHGMFVTARSSEGMARKTTSEMYKVAKTHSEDENE